MAAGLDVKGLVSDFATAMAHCLAQGAPWPGAVAVSGGGDSIALMHLLAAWAGEASLASPVVLTVDHGLSSASSRVATEAIGQARRLGLQGHKLVWRGEKPEADIEAAARVSRYRLMGRWCVGHNVQGLYLAHTIEDQAETFLLRLGRGSGLDGLSAMRPVSPLPVPEFSQIHVVRPLLGFERKALRLYLESRDVGWAEDPMNEDRRFARVRLRQAWPALEELGLSAERIAGAAIHLARARDALEAETALFLDEACRFRDGSVVLDGARLATAPAEIGLRALAHVLSRVSGEAYRPRFARLDRLYQAIRKGELVTARTLHGCRIGRAPKAAAFFGAPSLMVTRAPARKRAAVARTEQIS